MHELHFFVKHDTVQLFLQVEKPDNGNGVFIDSSSQALCQLFCQPDCKDSPEKLSSLATDLALLLRVGERTTREHYKKELNELPDCVQEALARLSDHEPVVASSVAASSLVHQVETHYDAAVPQPIETHDTQPDPVGQRQPLGSDATTTPEDNEGAVDPWSGWVQQPKQQEATSQEWPQAATSTASEWTAWSAQTWGSPDVASQPSLEELSTPAYVQTHQEAIPAAKQRGNHVYQWDDQGEDAGLQLPGKRLFSRDHHDDAHVEEKSRHASMLSEQLGSAHEQSGSMPRLSKVLASELNNTLAPGTAVEGFYDGAWYPGRVFAWLEPTQCYNVHWDDEDSRSELKPSEVRICMAQPGTGEHRGLVSVSAPPWPQDDDVEDASERQAMRQMWRDCHETIASFMAHPNDAPAAVKALYEATRDGTSMNNAQTEFHLAVLCQIYQENSGPRYMLQREVPHHRIVQDARLDVQSINFTHGKISPVFRGEPHAGRPLRTLVDAFMEGTTQVEDIRLKVAWHHGEYFSYNNRRLWCLKTYAEETKKQVFVPCTIIQLCPFTAKFALSYTSTNGGKSAELRLMRAPDA